MSIRHSGELQNLIFVQNQFGIRDLWRELKLLPSSPITRNEVQIRIAYPEFISNRVTKKAFLFST